MPLASTENPARKFRRRHYFIDRDFQGAFLVRFLVLTCFAAAVAGWFVYRSTTAAIEDQMFSAHLSATHTGQLVRGRLIITNLAVAATLLVAAIALAFRVARGCGFALRRARLGLEGVAQGDLTVQMWAKSGDHLNDLFRELNATIAHARRQAEEAKAELASTDDTGSEELEQRLRRCAAALRRIGPPL